MPQPLVPPLLLDSVVAYFNPRRVILFGSTARGEARPDSDIDLLVIVDDDTPPEKLTFCAGYEARQSYSDGSADVIPCRTATFQAKSRIAGTIPYEAARDGVIVYEKR
jgi:predicted nucleotidyltransferase